MHAIQLCIKQVLSDKLAVHSGVTDMLNPFKLHLKELFSSVQCEKCIAEKVTVVTT